MVVTREEYVKYLRTQAALIGFLADQIENNEPITLDWAVEWELRREDQYLVEQPAEEKEVV